MRICRFCKACKNNFCSSGFCHTYGVKCCLCVVLVLYLGKQFAKKPLPTPVCKRQTYVQKIKNKLGKNAILSLVQSMQKQFCSSGFCHTYGVKCCLCVVSVRYLGKQFAIKTLCQFPCAKGKLQCKKSKTNLGKIFFPMQKTANSRFLFFVVEVFILQKYKS